MDLTQKEQKLVTAKAKGATHHKAYDEAYSPPETTLKSTKVGNTSKILKRPHVKHALETAMKKHNITIDRSLAPISDALSATENHYNHKGELVEVTKDIKTRLQGSDRALKLLGVHSKEQQINYHLHKHSYDI